MPNTPPLSIIAASMTVQCLQSGITPGCLNTGSNTLKAPAQPTSLRKSVSIEIDYPAGWVAFQAWTGIGAVCSNAACLPAAQAIRDTAEALALKGG